MQILKSILFHGVIYSVVLSIILNLSQLSNPRIWLQDYPEDIQNKVSPKAEREKKLTLYHGIPFLLFMIFYPPLVTYYSLSNSNILVLFLHMFGIMFSFNLVDLIILDWLIFSYINPKYLVLSGTEGMKSYKNYKFHLKGFYKGTILSIIFGFVFSLVISWIIIP